MNKKCLNCIDDKGEMLLVGFSEEEIKFAKEYPEEFKLFLYLVGEELITKE